MRDTQQHGAGDPRGAKVPSHFVLRGYGGARVYGCLLSELPPRGWKEVTR